MQSKLFFLFLIVFSHGFAQDDHVQSLKNKLQQTIPDTMRARIYSDLALYITDEDEWTYYNKKALDLANQKLSSARGKERKIYLTIKGHSIGNLGYYYDQHGDRKKSLEHYFKALELYEQAGDQAAKANILSGIGVILTNQEDYQEALDYLHQALELKLKYEPNSATTSYLNLGVAYEGMGDSTKALNFYKQALHSGEKNDDFAGIAVANNNIGAYYYFHREYDTSIAYMKRAIENYRRVGDGSGVAWSMANLGSSFLNTNQLDSAEYYILRAKEISKAYENPFLSQNVAEHLYFLFSAKSDWENALINFRQAIKLRDSINSVDIQKDALKKKLEFDHQLEKTRLKTQQQEEKKRARQRLLFILAGLIMTMIFAIVIFRRLRITRKQKRTIEKQKSEVENQKGIIEEKNREIVDSINSAKRLQNAMLPEEKDVTDQFSDAFLIYFPKDIVAGDFYWVFKPDDTTCYVAAADCTGHGVPGALVSVICSNALDRAVKEFQIVNPGEILDKVTDLVIEQFEKSNEEVKNGMDIALCRVDLKNRTVDFSGAYNPLWIKRKAEQEIEVIRADRQPVGNFEYRKLFTTHTVKLAQGDWIYIFSDGFADQFGGAEGKKFKSANLKKSLLEMLQNGREDQQKEELIHIFNNWKGNLEQVDDVCFIGIKL